MPRNRPKWIDYFMGIAYVVSTRSHDENTQHGTVIIDRQKRILATGYNGLPKGIDEEGLPTARPIPGQEEGPLGNKYDWFDGLHSERNALANLRHPTDDMIAFVTGQCCNSCIMAMWQTGVTEVYMLSTHSGSQLLTDKTKRIFDEFIRRSQMRIHYIEADTRYLFSSRLRDFLPKKCHEGTALEALGL